MTPVAERLSDERIAEIVKDCDGVTPGLRWSATTHPDDGSRHFVTSGTEDADLADVCEISNGDRERKAKYLAHLDPLTVLSLLTELQHRRAAEAGPPPYGRDPIMLIADELVVLAANCASRNDGRAVRDVSRKLYAIATSPSSPATGVRVKALEWSASGGRYAYKSSFFTEWKADPDRDMRYVVRYVEHNPEAKPGYFVPPFEPYYSDGSTNTRYGSLVEVQAIHQADYEARIRSALGVQS